jgi:hypothetical protein
VEILGLADGLRVLVAGLEALAADVATLGSGVSPTMAARRFRKLRRLARQAV